jgi:hypothetical protein
MFGITESITTFVRQLRHKNMETKTIQINTYTITDAMGNNTSILFCASNLKEAVKIAKKNYPNQCYFGKVKRCYNGGVRG